jgi:hypothetical protein
VAVEDMAIELTPSELSDFFKSRDITWNCQVCNHAQWTAAGPTFGPNLPVVTMQVMAVLDREILEKYAPIEPDGGLTDAAIRGFLNSNAKISFIPTGFPVLVFVCKHCGFVRTHSASTIKNKEKDDNGDGKG